MDGYIRWSFANRGDLDGQWQMVRTFNPANWTFLERVTPEPDRKSTRLNSSH